LHEHPPCTRGPCMQRCAESGHSPGCPQPHGAHGTCGVPPLPSTPVLHQLRQHCLRLKKRVSSYNIRCVCLFATVTAGYGMAVLLHLPGARPTVVHHQGSDLHVSSARGGRALPQHARTRAALPGLSRAGAYSPAYT